jgi:hypothetical protein
MKVVELYGRVRYAVQIEGLSRWEVARQFGIKIGLPIPKPRDYVAKRQRVSGSIL